MKKHEWSTLLECTIERTREGKKALEDLEENERLIKRVNRMQKKEALQNLFNQNGLTPVEMEPTDPVPIEQFAGCPNLSNPYHLCTSWCLENWSNKPSTTTDEPSVIYTTDSENIMAFVQNVATEKEEQTTQDIPKQEQKKPAIKTTNENRIDNKINTFHQLDSRKLFNILQRTATLKGRLSGTLPRKGGKRRRK